MNKNSMCLSNISFGVVEIGVVEMIKIVMNMYLDHLIFLFCFIPHVRKDIDTHINIDEPYAQSKLSKQ
jgi:hypothetical protein